jgi:hypothetical protein
MTPGNWPIPRLRCDEALLASTLGGGGYERPEGSRSEQGIAVLAGDFARRPAQESRLGLEHSRSWLLCNLKDIGHAVDQIVDAVVVDQRVSSLVVADRAVQSIGPRVEDDDLMSLARESETASKTELEGHVETGRNAHPAQVVNGDTASADEAEDTDQASLASLTHLEDAMRCLPQRDKRADKRDEQPFVPRVERNIEEDGPRIRGSRHLALRGLGAPRPTRLVLERRGESIRFQGAGSH